MAHHNRRGGGSGRETAAVPVNEVAEQVLLTNYKALELFMSECHTIRRESGVFEPLVPPESPKSQQQSREPGRRHASPGDSARGTDHESSEEEGNLFLLFLFRCIGESVGYSKVVVYSVYTRLGLALAV